MVSGKHLVTDLEDRKRKFFIAINNVLTNSRPTGLSEECLVEMLVKQCMLILMHSCGNWCINIESKRRIAACFNRSIRRIFGYYDFEYVNDIHFGFGILLINIYIVKVCQHFVSIALRSNRALLKKYPE